jgi:hypothetical protein
MKRQYDVAQLKGDGSWFERTLVDDYIFVLPDGTVVTKAEAVNDLSSGDLVWGSVMARTCKPGYTETPQSSPAASMVKGSSRARP